MKLTTEFNGRERGRIGFLLQRDGVDATIAWVRRTLRIYRVAVLDKHHYASGDRFRRTFIESYCGFNRWLTRMHAYGASKQPLGTVLDVQRMEMLRKTVDLTGLRRY